MNNRINITLCAMFIALLVPLTGSIMGAQATQVSLLQHSLTIANKHQRTGLLILGCLGAGLIARHFLRATLTPSPVDPELKAPEEFKAPKTIDLNAPVVSHGGKSYVYSGTYLFQITDSECGHEPDHLDIIFYAIGSKSVPVAIATVCYTRDGHYGQLIGMRP